MSFTYRNVIGTSFVASAAPALMWNVARNGVGVNGTPNGTPGSKRLIAGVAGFFQYTSVKYGVVGVAPFGTRASTLQVKTASFLTVLATHAPGASNPPTSTLVTSTSLAPRFTASSDSFTPWPPITRPSSATASNVRPCAARTAFW